MPAQLATGVNLAMPMRCPQCRHELALSPKKGFWTEAQRRGRSPSIGGRNCCIPCYNQGPKQEDYQEVRVLLSRIAQLSAAHRDSNYAWQHFMFEFLQHMDAHTRKKWSHKGLLPVRCETDYKTALPRGQEAFDPRNKVYAIVMRREVPNLAENMSWASAGEVLCGDCIEALMGAAAAAAHQRGPSLEELDDEEIWEGANHFFTEYAYVVWRIYRVKSWHDDTVGSMTQHDDLVVRRLLQRVHKCFSARDCFPAQRMIRLSARRMMPLPECDHPSVSVGSFSADRRTPVDLRDCAEPEVSARPLCRRCGFPSTSVCSSCQVAGCGLCIYFSSHARRLLCRQCRQPSSADIADSHSSSSGIS